MLLLVFDSKGLPDIKKPAIISLALALQPLTKKVISQDTKVYLLIEWERRWQGVVWPSV